MKIGRVFLKSVSGFMLVLLTFAAVQPAAAETESCVSIWYDASPDPTYTFGEMYSIFLRNLIGHFPKRRVYVSPVENYLPGDIEMCQASFYIGTHFYTSIPDSFLKDFQTTKRNVMWLGYGIWKLKEAELKNALGIKYVGLTTLDKTKLDKQQRPTFFKNVNYKGEIFWKFGEFVDKEKKEFRAPFEQARVEVVDRAGTQVLATVEHNGTKETIPYAIRSKNRFYVTDVPFQFMHEADRYLVFSDLLFDVLEEKPRFTGKRPAVFRFEDIHARVPQYQVYDVAGPLKELNVPLHIALIPIFYDPLNKYGRAAEEEMILFHQDPLFLNLITDLSNQTTRYVMHGVSHQYKSMKNPHTATSGDDFEFWDIINNSPVKEDSVKYVLNRLDDGWETLSKGGLKPRLWEVPHYQASMLDYMIFARVFAWNVGRIMYAPMEVKGLSYQDFKPLRYENSGIAGRQARFDAFKDLQVTWTGAPNGQFFPFEIYGDVYGQRVIPENLGNPQPFENRHVSHPRTIDEILAAARRNMKLRDVWGSLFFHPQLTDSVRREGVGAFPGDASELRRLINEMRSMGYEFIDLDRFMNDAGDQLRPESQVTPRSTAQGYYTEMR